jgi:hypothetical protein
MVFSTAVPTTFSQKGCLYRLGLFTASNWGIFLLGNILLMGTVSSG